ncbi:MAG: phosphoglucosamine mutase [Candidatus Thermoplasmatota archaeon]|nr:phosphoglucosamine mutase [Candidatus Thermoplasmatota archaeon]
MSLFGSSGIRGIVNEKITPDLIHEIGKTVGEDNQEVILGRDTRPTGDMVSSALISGLTSVGADVKRAGMVSTPTLAQSANEFDCGIMVTASHNPEEYNGIKFWNPDGSSFDSEQMEEIERRVKEKSSLSSWEKVGRVERYEGAIEEHISRILKKIGREYDQKVIVDCANGAASLITPYLLREMGCEVVTLNSQPDGTFPAHESEPVEENLTDLKSLVKNSDADLGIAHDGDGDRMVAFDENGSYLGGDRLLALFARSFSSVVVPVNSSMVIDDLADKVTRSKVGDVYVSEKLKEKNAEFGGEPSGTWIFPKVSYGPDGVYAAALLVKMSVEMDLSSEVDQLPSYPRKKSSVKIEEKREVMENLISLYQDTYSENELNFADGIRFEEENGWGLIRASGTEPKIRITAEARSEEEVESIFENAKDKLSRVRS